MIEARAESTNYEKFRTDNPVVQRLIGRFYAHLRSVVEPLGAESLLDAGCGEGETLARMDGLLPDDVFAVDLSEAAVQFTAARFPTIEVGCHSIDNLPFDNDNFDLVLCLEVLEHLEDPGAALDELARVSRRNVIVSTPHEPWFRLGSLLRGKYVSGLGNHPEHVNHWNPRTLGKLLHTRFEAVRVEGSFPWLIAHCQTPNH